MRIRRVAAPRILGSILLGACAFAVLVISRRRQEASAEGLSRATPVIAATQAPAPPIDDTSTAGDLARPTITLHPAEVRLLKVGPNEHPVFAYAPMRLAEQRKPVIVMLHGMCDTPQNECAAFQPAANSLGFLLCPRANGPCSNGGAMWRGSPAEKRELVDASLAELDNQFTGAVSTEGDATLVGFSQGAYLALDMVTRHKGPWSSLILIGASVEPNARALASAGIRRVLLASGDYDGAKPAMQAAAARLSNAGFEATWKSLGPVGHQFAFDMNAWMALALDWVRR